MWDCALVFESLEAERCDAIARQLKTLVRLLELYRGEEKIEKKRLQYIREITQGERGNCTVPKRNIQKKKKKRLAWVNM